MKRILLVDNYDSFTYNLVHYLEALDCEVTVCYNDSIPTQVLELFDAVVLSPGPGLPEESGDLLLFIDRFLGQLPMLGVCLGMQALALQLGGEIYNQKMVKHGLQESISVEKSTLFSTREESFEVGLYHSWAVREDDNYEVTAKSLSGVIMAIENREKRCYGVQFHPESIMTPRGKEVLQNFLKMVPITEVKLI